MNLYLRNIMRLLNVNEALAWDIYHKMMENGFDFSEATDQEFRVAAEQAEKELSC